MIATALNSKEIREHVCSLTSHHPIGVAEKMSFLNQWCDADYVAVTSSGQVYEYEIKTSRGDYLRDFKKARHRIYAGNGDSQGREGRTPNRFWYVTNPGIVRNDLPEWAGWYELEDGQLIERVKAPLMWRGTHDIKVIMQLAAAMRRRGDQ